MPINSAQDHGFNEYPRPREIRKGAIGRFRCALGIYEARVLGPHRQEGYECVFVRWITPVESFRQGFVGSIEWHSRDNMLSAIYGD